MDVEDSFSKLISENGEIGSSSTEIHLQPTLRISCIILLNSYAELERFRFCFNYVYTS